MSWENALLMKLSNDVEKYEIEVTKMGQNYSFFLTVCGVQQWPYLTSQFHTLKLTLSVHLQAHGQATPTHAVHET